MNHLFKIKLIEQEYFKNIINCIFLVYSNFFDVLVKSYGFREIAYSKRPVTLSKLPILTFTIVEHGLHNSYFGNYYFGNLFWLYFCSQIMIYIGKCFIESWKEGIFSASSLEITVYINYYLHYSNLLYLWVGFYLLKWPR